MTIFQVAQKWEIQKKLFVKESTLSAYRLLLRNHILPKYGDLMPDSITNIEMQEFAMQMIGKGLSKKTTVDAVICFKMILNTASEIGLCQAIKFNVKYPTSTDRKDHFEVYTEDEQKKIITWIVSNLTHERLGILITLCTGLRIGEITALKWINVDVEKGLIHVRSTLQRIYNIGLNPEEDSDEEFLTGNRKRGKTRLVFGEPKTSDSYRSVPIAKDLLNILKSYKKTSNQDYFVATGSEKAIESRLLRVHYFDMIKNKVGLSRCIKFHGLRHSFATRMIANGADIKTTSTILGHAKVEMTMNLYVHPSAENKNKAVNKSMRGLFN